MQSYQGKPCICCGSTQGTVGHHVKSVGSGGGNEPYNIMVLCHKTHRLIHDKGLFYVSKRIPSVYRWLDVNGWEIMELQNKWIRYGQMEDDF